MLILFSNYFSLVCSKDSATKGFIQKNNPFLQEFMYNDARDRQFLMFFHKLSKRKTFDVKRYNEIKDSITKIQDDLNVLRSPLFLHLPENARLELLGKLETKEDKK